MWWSFYLTCSFLFSSLCFNSYCFCFMSFCRACWFARTTSSFSYLAAWFSSFFFSSSFSFFFCCFSKAFCLFRYFSQVVKFLSSLNFWSASRSGFFELSSRIFWIFICFKIIELARPLCSFWLYVDIPRSTAPKSTP